jgi:site-specific recombinase XerD
MSEYSRFSWEEALSGFLLHCQATRAKKTHYYYKVQLSQLMTWAAQNEIPFDGFGKRQLDRYLIHRAEGGRKPLTLHHDAICAKAFMAWCSKNDLLDRSLLAEYQVRNAPDPARYMPTQDEIDGILRAIRDYWDVTKHPDVRYYDVHKHIFHRDRNYAALVGLLDTACRVGELFNLKLDDYRAKER